MLKEYDDLGKLWRDRSDEPRIAAVEAILESAADDVRSGLLTSLERRTTSDVLSDLVQLARLALSRPSDGSKNVAAVLVAAAYEDRSAGSPKSTRASLGKMILTW